jgi:F0F1-type ATP synthase membrane subunit b/b'
VSVDLPLAGKLHGTDDGRPTMTDSHAEGTDADDRAAALQDEADEARETAKRETEAARERAAEQVDEARREARDRA